MSEGKLSLVGAETLGKNGFPYFHLRCEKGWGRVVPFTIFYNELEWLALSTAALASRLNWDKFDATGIYPLLHRVRSAGGLCWFLELNQHGKRNLLLRRYNTSFKTGQEDRTQYTRYFEFSRTGKWYQQVVLSEADVRSETLQTFAEGCMAVLQKDMERLSEEVQRDHGVVLAPRDVYRRLSIRDSHNHPDRSLLAYPTYQPGPEYQALALSQDAETEAMGLLSSPRSDSTLSNAFNGALDAKAVHEFTHWTSRYEPTVLGKGYLFTVLAGSGKEQQALAQRDVGLFASDPLLLSLGQGIPTTKKGPNSRLAISQCSDAAFDKATAKGWIASQVLTPLGRVPIPSPERQATIQTFCKPPAVLNRHRYKILQLLALASSAARNFPGGLTGDVVIQLQSLALLRSDVTGCQTGENGEAMAAMAEKASASFHALLRAEESVAPLPQLPRRSDVA